MTEGTSIGVRTASSASSPIRSFARAVGAVLFVLFPPLAAYGISIGATRLVAAILLCAFLPLVWLRGRGPAARVARGLGVLPFVTLGALALAAGLGRAGFVLAVPAAINVALLATFGASLRRGSVPMIERFARLQVEQPTPEQQRWCRTWTWLWCAFFVVNGSLAASLAVWAPLSWWTVYNGFVAYVSIGAMLAIEWILRRRRFPAT